MRAFVCTIIFALAFFHQGFSQDYASAAARFNQEVAAFDQIEVNDEPLVLFMGSSSVRLYKNVAQLSDKVRILNTGFGGSTAFGLLTYLDQSVLRFKPKQVFIYEGETILRPDAPMPPLLRTSTVFFSAFGPICLKPRLSS